MTELPKPLQVYVVEDSPIIRRLLASTIEAAGAQLVGNSADAQIAIAELSELRPDLILIDISLDVGTGFDVLRALQGRSLNDSSVKVVLTNYSTPEHQNLSYRLGADSFFDKSSDTAQVLALISALAAEKRLSRKAQPDGGNPH